MREILFRAQRIDNGKWVEGDLIHGVGYEKGNMFILPIKQNLAYLEGCHPLNGYQVIPESVCQFTGLTDKNGTSIFEGDVLRVKEYKNGFMFESMEFRETFELHDLEANLNKEYISSVYYEDCSFVIKESNTCNICLGALCGNMKHSQPIYEFEIIGNLIDSPELLK